jgi:flagellar biosynthesis/type III secretory pathway protein FliH
MYIIEEGKNLFITFWNKEDEAREDFTFRVNDSLLSMTEEDLRKIVETAHKNGFDQGWEVGFAEGMDKGAREARRKR